MAEWTHVTGVGGNLVLLYNAINRTAETGVVDADGLYTGLMPFSGWAEWTRRHA